MYILRLDATRDAAFLAEERKDPVTLCVYEAGQEVVACAGCRAVYLASTWTQIGGKCALCSPAAKGPTPTLPLNSTEDLIVRMRMTRTTERFRIHSPSATTIRPNAPPAQAFPRTPVAPMRHPVQMARRRSRIGRVLRNAVVAAVIVVAVYGVMSFVCGQIAGGALDSVLANNGMMGIKGFAEGFLSLEQHVGLRSEPRELRRTEPVVDRVTLASFPVESIRGTSCGYYLDAWKGFVDQPLLRIGRQEYDSGIGWYIISNACDETGYGYSRAEYRIDGKYSTLSFDLGADPSWYFGDVEEYGMYRVTIEAYTGTDVYEAYDSDWLDYRSEAYNVQVDLRHAKNLSIRLEQRRGTEGTLNIVFGNAMLNT